MTTSSSTSVPEVDPQSPSRPSPAAFAKARASRPELCGSYAPERPYPIYLRGLVERGFGRGGKDLGCPTANLPSKIIQSHPSLNRTGIYYGFARILPQDPDDPDLADEGEEAAVAGGSATGSGLSWHDGGGSSSGGGDGSEVRAAGQTLASRRFHNDDFDDDDDDVDVQTDDDGDEVVLSASPVNEGHDIEHVGQASDGSHFIFKPRQLSRSSVHSSRSVRTILEKAGALNLERTTSGGSGGNGGQTASSESSPLSPVSAEPVGRSRQPGEPSSSSSTTKGPPPSYTDKHPRDTSATSSQAGSVRRKKKLRVAIASQDARVYPMVMSVGWNPFYKNTTKTAEVHILHNFNADFYGLEMRVVVLGYIRPEFNYVSKEALIEDIEMDKKVAVNSLARNPYQDYVTDPFLMAPS